MNLKHIASAKMLLSHWSPSKLNNLLEETDIEMSPGAGLCQPQQHQALLRAAGAAQRAASQGVPGPDYLQCQQRGARRQPADCLSRIYRAAAAAQLLLAVRPVLPVLRGFNQLRSGARWSRPQFYNKYLAQPLYESYVRFFSLLAIKASVYILAGTMIVRTREGLYNRAFLFDPDGNIGPAAGQAPPLPL